MIRSVLALLTALVLAPVAAAQSSPPGRSNQSPPDRIKVGIGHFERAFYELTPQKRNVEASAEYDLAVAAFERALAEAPGSVEAHTYLARIHTARKNFRQAARHYDQVTALEPMNVDVFARAAQAYFRAGDFETARARLVEARLRTSDPGALALLDEYLAKVDARKR